MIRNVSFFCGLNKWQWMVAAIVGLLLALLAFLVFGQRPDSEGGQRQSIADQQACSAQAGRVFIAEGWRLKGALPDGTMASYSSHYNPDLARCFIETHISSATGKAVMHTTVVTDAYDDTPYGAFTNYGPLSAPLVSNCNVTIPNTPRVACKSEKEWRWLLRPYIATDAITD